MVNTQTMSFVFAKSCYCCSNYSLKSPYTSPWKGVYIPSEGAMAEKNQQILIFQGNQKRQWWNKQKLLCPGFLVLPRMYQYSKSTAKLRFWNTFTADRNFYNINHLDFGIYKSRSWNIETSIQESFFSRFSPKIFIFPTF